MPLYRIFTNGGESVLIEAQSYHVVDQKDGTARVTFTDTGSRKVAEFNLNQIVGFVEADLIRKPGN